MTPEVNQIVKSQESQALVREHTGGIGHVADIAPSYKRLADVHLRLIKAVGPGRAAEILMGAYAGVIRGETR